MNENKTDKILAVDMAKMPLLRLNDEKRGVMVGMVEIAARVVNNAVYVTVTPIGGLPVIVSTMGVSLGNVKIR